MEGYEGDQTPNARSTKGQAELTGSQMKKAASVIVT